jgi:hypothetical protein
LFRDNFSHTKKKRHAIEHNEKAKVLAAAEEKKKQLGEQKAASLIAELAFLTLHDRSIHLIRNHQRHNMGELDELYISWQEGARALKASLSEKRAVEEKVAASLAQTKAARMLDLLVKEKENTKVYQKTLDEAIQQRSFEKANIEAGKARNRQIEMEERGHVSIYCCCLSFADF